MPRPSPTTAPIVARCQQLFDDLDFASARAWKAAALAWFDAHLAGKSAASLGFAVQAARHGMIERVRAKLAAVEGLYLQKLMSTRDAEEGLRAFLEKRPAKWEDR